MRAYTLLSFLLLVVVFGCDDSTTSLTTDVEGSIQFQSQYGNDGDENWVGDLYTAMVTVINGDEELVYESVLLDQNVKLALPLGEYKLTQFVLLNKENEAVYAVPLEGSEKASLTDNPLPIGFTINSGEDLALSLIVVLIDDSTPEQFGYTGYSFDVAEIDTQFIVNFLNASEGDFEGEIESVDALLFDGETTINVPLSIDGIQAIGNQKLESGRWQFSVKVVHEPLPEDDPNTRVVHRIQGHLSIVNGQDVVFPDFSFGNPDLPWQLMQAVGIPRSGGGDILARAYFKISDGIPTLEFNQYPIYHDLDKISVRYQVHDGNGVQTLHTNSQNFGSGQSAHLFETTSRDNFIKIPLIRAIETDEADFKRRRALTLTFTQLTLKSDLFADIVGDEVSYHWIVPK